jgi:hypothetical protein
VSTPINGYGGPDRRAGVDSDGSVLHGRAMRIAAIHAFADFLADRPDLPMPQSIVAQYTVTANDEIDEWTRVASVMSVLHGMAASPYEGEHTVQGDLAVATLKLHGIEITYRAAAMKDPTPPNRYVTRETGR